MDVPVVPAKPVLELGKTLWGYFRVVGEDVGGSIFLPFREGQKFYLLCGFQGEERLITHDKLQDIIDNPPTHRTYRISDEHGSYEDRWTLTYEDQRNACIRLVLRFSIDRTKIRFV